LDRSSNCEWRPPFGTGQWVAVGGGTNIIASTNGTSWTASESKGGIGTYAFGVAYGNGLWVAVGNGSVIAKSTDRNTWVSADSSGGIIDGRRIAYGKDGGGNELWVAVGSGTVIARSFNGTNWVAANLRSDLLNGRGVAYGKDSNGNGLWIAVGAGSYAVKSTDGSNWERVSTTTLFVNTNLLDIAYGNGLWMIAAYDNVMISTNAITWSTVSTYVGYVHSVAYGRDGSGNGLWVAVGNPSGNSPISKSTDGTIWSTVNSLGGMTYGRGVTYGNGLWVAIGSNIVISTDGNNWISATSNGSIVDGQCVAFTS
jgi:hypothetical protein